MVVYYHFLLINITIHILESIVLRIIFVSFIFCRATLDSLVQTSKGYQVFKINAIYFLAFQFLIFS